MKNLCLYIDESGAGNPKAQDANCYIVCGCLVQDFKREDLKIKADQIKYKYWDRTNIVFHSREIGRKEGEFKILKDKKVEEAFNKDLIRLLNYAPIQLFVTLVDHEKVL